MNLSYRSTHTHGSRTARFIPLMKSLRDQGRDVISLAIGEPDMDTPADIIAATQDALSRQETRYSDIAGLPVLREALARRFDGCGPESIVIFNGSKQALYTTFQVICDPGDEVIVPIPCWVSFPEQIALAGGLPVFVPTCDHQLDINAIATAVTDKTRAILVNSPNNPTGAVYPAKTLQQVAKLAMDHNLFLIADEAYDVFVYDSRTPVSLWDFPEVRDRLILIRSFSKHYAMTGFRVGYAVAPPDAAGAMVRIHSQITGNVCTFSQYGALSALQMDEAGLIQQRNHLEQNRNLALECMDDLFPCICPGGAFYLFPDVRGHLQKGETADDFSLRILEKTGVMVAPGTDFGMDGHVRICFAVPEIQLKEAFRRIRSVL
ncbi:pyridoxal phosphate-dependent aminotransferase [Desulfosarcina sp. OttesenSCG-928-A07]|nr:pyridoxal phosphate-dependent aminotransferase [Desulfosarcina sp. OttesenSCG-928-G17]MDL2329317.1 pyridoxal phosphate-dependent aminotransferase [Desulfosarcina sp. OttesenSCG-928-A07]